MSATVDLACELIRRPSVTPDDAGCQALMIERLERIGFTVERLDFGGVSNFWARRGSAGPLFAFAGHTDVVPPGPLDRWDSDPFRPTLRDGWLYGRGAADMKGSLAAMVTACEALVRARPGHRGSVALLITSDEEGPAVDGTVRVVDRLLARGERIDYCLVGEPSSSERLGDVIKNGRRGSLGATLRVYGVQGHVAYPEQVRNPIHRAGAMVAALAAETWDRGNDYFPPTSFQVSNFNAGTGADNVVPECAEVRFNFRFSTESRAEALQARCRDLIERQLTTAADGGRSCRYEIDWRLSGQPFLTEPGALVDAARAAVADELGVTPALLTTGGTSDGRFIAPTGAQVVELGPVNATIHQLNERVWAGDLDKLSRVYRQVMERLLSGDAEYERS